jgi:lysozyme family protein
MNDFDICLVHTLKFEGGYSDHPDDPGGATKWGITERVYHRWCREIGNSIRSVRLMSKYEVEAIYIAKYWTSSYCDSMPSLASKILLFDAAVNHGVSRAIKLLQRSVSAKEDGIVGPATLAATGMGGFENDFLWERVEFFNRISKKPHPFLKGWMNRAIKLRKIIRSL